MRGRKDGHASWCKRCSNSKRKAHKKSPKKAEYKLVAQMVLKEGKPKTCPSCMAEGVPSHLMRGRVAENGAVKWDCVRCRNAELVENRLVTCYCGWCCEEFKVVPHMKNKQFCDDQCLNAWRSARAQRRERTESKSKSEPGDPANDEVEPGPPDLQLPGQSGKGMRPSTLA